MSEPDLSLLPAYKLSQELMDRRVSPVDVMDAFLARIEKHEPKLHPFVDVYADDARVAARGAEAAIRSGHAGGPLHGLPIALKDLIEIEGKVVTGGRRGAGSLA